MKYEQISESEETLLQSDGHGVTRSAGRDSQTKLFGLSVLFNALLIITLAAIVAERQFGESWSDNNWLRQTSHYCMELVFTLPPLLRLTSHDSAALGK